MSAIEDVVEQVILGKIEAGYIPCTSRQNQESIRVMTFNVKNKLPEEFKHFLAISKFNKEGKFYVKVYKKPSLGFMVMDESGELVQMKVKWNIEKDQEFQRQLKYMKEDGKSEEEIQKTIKEKKEEEDSKFKELKPEKIRKEGLK